VWRQLRGGSSPLIRIAHRRADPESAGYATLWTLRSKQVMTVRADDIDAQQRFDEKERARRADADALRSGKKTEAQLQRENDFFPLPPDRFRINLDSARSLS
jgi:hypothetical protein